ncbi:Amidase 1 [Capsicum annuum]|uniref:Amidase 1 n=1 Tax=Capsicum annuum TaxID=4072 RepID=A0A1U8E755_CAPAN|nr:amidase 1 [Capsicum annuum]XP_047259811.1 amidase 1-like [Capsicum annuum]KAF3663059.1 Amidase 1 [Capsicum annuum]PHT70649.1 Amidase 1 [Capsicum annuum]
MEMEASESCGAFMEKFTLQPICSASEELPLNGLTFAVKDIFDVEGHVTGFGNPEWANTHSAATSTAPTVVSLLNAGATCVGKTVMDEMAYSINGENFHYGTPINPVSSDRVPGGSSSGSAVAVGAKLVDFSLGTDTGGSVRVPASYCGIYGIRPSHGVVSTAGVIPMAQSFDTVGWFARDLRILKLVGIVLLQSDSHSVGPSPTNIYIAEDCFKLLDSKSNYQLIDTLVNSTRKLYGSDDMIKYLSLGDYIEGNVPSLKKFMTIGTCSNVECSYIPSSLRALSCAMRLLQMYEFKENHGEWVSNVKPSLGPGIAERVQDALKTTDENIDVCRAVKAELRAALTALLGDCGILAIPTVPGPPPKLRTDTTALEGFRAKAFSLLSIAGVSGFCQVSIPLGIQDNLPISVSLLANHGSDWLLLNVVEAIHNVLQE